MGKNNSHENLLHEHCFPPHSSDHVFVSNGTIAICCYSFAAVAVHLASRSAIRRMEDIRYLMVWAITILNFLTLGNGVFALAWLHLHDEFCKEEILCIFFQLYWITTVLASLFTTVLITLDRCLFICYAFFYLHFMSTRKVFVAISLVWLTAISIGLGIRLTVRCHWQHRCDIYHLIYHSPYLAEKVMPPLFLVVGIIPAAACCVILRSAAKQVRKIEKQKSNIGNISKVLGKLGHTTTKRSRSDTELNKTSSFGNRTNPYLNASKKSYSSQMIRMPPSPSRADRKVTPMTDTRRESMLSTIESSGNSDGPRQVVFPSGSAQLGPSKKAEANIRIGFSQVVNPGIAPLTAHPKVIPSQSKRRVSTPQMVQPAPRKLTPARFEASHGMKKETTRMPVLPENPTSGEKFKKLSFDLSERVKAGKPALGHPSFDTVMPAPLTGTQDSDLTARRQKGFRSMSLFTGNMEMSVVQEETGTPTSSKTSQSLKTKSASVSLPSPKSASVSLPSPVPSSILYEDDNKHSYLSRLGKFWNTKTKTTKNDQPSSITNIPRTAASTSKCDDIKASKSDDLKTSKSGDIKVSKSGDIKVSKSDDLKASKSGDIKASKSDESKIIDKANKIKSSGDSKGSLLNKFVKTWRKKSPITNITESSSNRSVASIKRMSLDAIVDMWRLKNKSSKTDEAACKAQADDPLEFLPPENFLADVTYIKYMATMWKRKSQNESARQLDKEDEMQKWEDGCSDFSFHVKSSHTLSVMSSASSSTIDEFLGGIQQKLTLLSKQAQQAGETITLRLRLVYRVSEIFIILMVCWLPFIILGWVGPTRASPGVVGGFAFLVCFNSMANFITFMRSEKVTSAPIKSYLNEFLDSLEALCDRRCPCLARSIKRSRPVFKTSRSRSLNPSLASRASRSRVSFTRSFSRKFSVKDSDQMYPLPEGGLSRKSSSSSYSSKNSTLSTIRSNKDKRTERLQRALDSKVTRKKRKTRSGFNRILPTWLSNLLSTPGKSKVKDKEVSLMSR